MVELYGEGLVRILDEIDNAGEVGAGIRARLMEDGVVASLMLVHDLYPVDLPTRVEEALASVRPYLESHGGNVELLGVADGVARISLVGHCKTCPASDSRWRASRHRSPGRTPRISAAGYRWWPTG
jgi:hypothetical protein